MGKQAVVTPTTHDGRKNHIATQDESAITEACSRKGKKISRVDPNASELRPSTAPPSLWGQDVSNGAPNAQGMPLTKYQVVQRRHWHVDERRRQQEPGQRGRKVL